MSCQHCISEPVIQLSNSQSLCKSCFLSYFEKKVFSTIRAENMIADNDHVGIAVSGGKDSTTVLYLMHQLVKEWKGLRLTAIAIDEGIAGYRDITLDGLQKFCQKEKITLNIFSFKDLTGKDLDVLVQQFPRACSICGVLRRYLLNTKARALGITKLVTGHNMDDEAQSILMNQFRRNMRLSARLGPVTGMTHDPKFIPRIKPLYFLSEKEVATYAFIQGFMETYNECPHASDSYRAKVRDMLYAFDADVPGTKEGIIRSFLEVLPQLKIKYQGIMKYCIKCGEPAAQDVCKACQFIEAALKSG